MLDRILSSLKEKATPELMSRLGLDATQANGSVMAAADSVKEVVVGDNGFGMDDALSLFSNATNSSGADGMMGKIGEVLMGKLTGSVGLDAGKAGGVSAMLMPMVMDLVSKYVGGDAKNLQGLIGGGGIADAAKGMLGNLFK
ncbi:MAG: hypothetical protein KDC00_08270 [Flavobacteriales bacterium]|nr:hypothetical protein [Flavobacteriales bacterium]